MKIKKNLCGLIKEAYFYQYAGIADPKDNIQRNQNKPIAFFSKTQWVLICISIGVNFILPKGFSSSFSGYVISGFSLFVGIFFTFILMLFDKFQAIDFTQYKKSVNAEKHPLGVRLKNYFKKITVLSLYTIILSIICILLLSITLLFEPITSKDISIIHFFQHIQTKTVCVAFQTIVILSYRTISFYFLLDFVLITIYLIASFYDFIISEYNKIKLS